MMITRVIMVSALIFFAPTNGDVGTEELKKELAALRSDVNQAALRSDVDKELDTLRSEVQVLSKQVSVLTNSLNILISHLSEQVKAVTKQMEDEQIVATQQTSAAINQLHTITSLTGNVKSYEKSAQLPGDLLL